MPKTSPSLATKVARDYIAAIYTRLRTAMSLPEAKKVLGFPPEASPTPAEISKAYKSKALEAHPDRGGTNEQMVAVNVAKEILDGVRRPDYAPKPPPPPSAWGPAKAEPPRGPAKVVDTIPGDSFETAMSRVPMDIEWKIASKGVYVRGVQPVNHNVWTFIGVGKDRVWVLAIKERPGTFKQDWAKNELTEIKTGWQISMVSTPLQGFEKKIVLLVKGAPTFQDIDGMVLADTPKKWIVWEGGRPQEKEVLSGKLRGSGGVALKDALLAAGMLGDTAIKGRKSAVQITPRYISSEERKVRQEALRAKQNGKLYNYQLFNYEVSVNGKSAILAPETNLNLEKNGFIIGVFSYDPKDGVPKRLNLIRGGVVKASPGVYIRLLADALTTEPSWLHIALKQAAEEWESEATKTARAAARRIAAAYESLLT